MFRETFARNPEEVDFPYLFHVHGNGGVGKSTLVRQWEATAREQASVVTAFVDDEVHDPLEAMETISARLSRQGHPLKKFDKHLVTYRQRRHQAESTVPVQQPIAGEAGAGEAMPASPSSTVAAQVGLVGLGMLPGFGAFAGAVDPGQVALGADRMRAMLNTRLRSHDDVQLVMNPLANLAPVFLEELAEVAERCERVVLFFDVYERTGPVLDAWLRSIIFTEDHGTLPVNVQIVLAGRSHLDLRVWGDHLGQVTEVGLDVFTEDEARTLLATHGVTGEENIELVLRLSGRLPLLVDMLARSGPGTSVSVTDPSETAVERFLKWEPDPERREAAQACALPLQLDEDIYQLAVPGSAADGYPWLRAQAFVSHQAGRCRYHDVVRDTMLRLQRTQSPARWQQQHTRLADAFAQWRRGIEVGLGTDTDAYWDDVTWREHRLNEIYHRLCASPRTALPDALLQITHATDHDIATLRRWAQTLSQAGRDAGAPVLITWGQRLEAAAEHEAAGISALTLLLSASELDTAARALVHTVRARDHRIAGEYANALADYATAHRLAPDTARVYAGRGETCRLMGRYDEALTNLNRAIELDPQADWVFCCRGETYRSLGRYDDALTDFDRAIELDARDGWSLYERAMTYRLLGRFDDALSDFDRAIELNPNYTWAIITRGLTYRSMDRYDDALSDYNRAIELNPNYAWAIANRGLTYRLMDRYDEALSDYNRAIELDLTYAWAIAGRGETYRSMDRYDEALSEFNRAIELNPNYAWAIASRGQTYQGMGRHDDALTDLDRAIELDPDYTWAIAHRGEIHRSLKRYDEALT
ncbi:tetratricopeptide repeat protein, partial [Streptomyces niveus]|uniref:tetratricopeptide repeat protein n=1 Tax=Streptomyces niveus TaxID=193462 RepID=UPI00362A3F8D